MTDWKGAKYSDYKEEVEAAVRDINRGYERLREARKLLMNYRRENNIQDPLPNLSIHMEPRESLR